MMRYAILVAMFFGTSSTRADEAKDEMKKLQGTWKIVSVEEDGEVRLPKDFGDVIPKSLKIAGDRIDSLLDRESFPFAIDPKQKPKHMDVRQGDNNDSEITKWIYALDGDELKLAVTFDLKIFGGESDRSRPKSFETKGNKVIVVNLKREKK